MNTDKPLPEAPPHTPEELRELLAARDARLQEFSALIARTRHDLNNLLTGVLGQAQLMLMREDMTPNVRQRLETLEELAKRMQETIAELNDV